DPEAMSRLDGRVPPLAFDDPSAVDIAKLRVGFFVDDGFLPPSAAIVRGVERAVSALQAAGASASAFTPPLVREAIEGYFAALSSDGGVTVLRQLEGHAVHPALESLRKLATLSPRTRSLAARVAGLARQKRLQR